MKKRFLGILFSVIFLPACMGNSFYHPTFKPCTVENNANSCKTNSIQAYTSPDGSENYTLGFVEFDDQGQLFDRNQLDSLTEALYSDVNSKDLLLIVFVHGWRHNSEESDENLAEFKKILKGTSSLETAVSKSDNRNARKVVGVYLGWRGLSVNAPGLTFFTFWDRKNTAHKVGHSGVIEVLSKLEMIKNVRNQKLRDPGSPAPTQLVVIGHSFGGAVLYSALSQVLMDRFIHPDQNVGVDGDVAGFGDLVVLVNPAFEALQFSTLRQMSNKRTYFNTQLPVLAVMTSEADTATGFWFPFGRFFSTLPEKYYGDEKSADRTALGHYDPFITHHLYYADYDSQDEDPEEPNCPGGGKKPANKKAEQSENRQERKLQVESSNFRDVKEGWDSDQLGFIGFPGSELEHHLDKSGPHNPYLNILVDKQIIPNHDNIYCKRVRDFIQHLIILSSPRPKNTTSNGP